MGAFSYGKLALYSAILSVTLIAVGAGQLIGAAKFDADINGLIDRGENNIAEMKMNDYSSGQNVYGYIAYVFDEVCEETTTNTTYGIETSSRVSTKYYLVPCITDNDTYVTVAVKNKNTMEKFDKLIDQTYSYLIGDNDGNSIEPHYFTGKVVALESEVDPYVIDWFNSTQWYNGTSEIQKHYAKYEIVEYSAEATRKSGVIMLLIGGVVGALMVAFILARKHKHDEIIAHEKLTMEMAVAAANAQSNEAVENPAAIDEISPLKEAAPAYVPAAAESEIPQPEVQPTEIFEQTSPSENTDEYNEQNETPDEYGEHNDEAEN